jgi:hypothetical protein
MIDLGSFSRLGLLADNVAAASGSALIDCRRRPLLAWPLRAAGIVL